MENKIIGQRITEDGIVMEDIPEHRHFFQCAVCGQQVDMRDLGQVFEHEHEDEK